MKWGIRSMVWYVFILVIAFCVSLYNYLKFIDDPMIHDIFFNKF